MTDEAKAPGGERLAMNREGSAIVTSRFDLELLGALFDNLPDHVVIIGADLRYQYMNRAAEEYIGYPRGYVIGRSVREILGYDYVERTQDIAERLAKGEIVSFQAWVKYPNGERLYAHNLFAPCINASGKHIAYVCFVRNLTAEKLRAEQLAESQAALAASERIHKEIVHSALDAFVLADDQGRVIDFNPAAEAMLGHARDTAIGRKLSDLIIPHIHRSAHEAGMARYMATGESRVMGKRLQLEALAASGELIPVEVTINEVRLPERRLFTAHMRDLREARRAQAEIEEHRARIHQIEKLSAMGSLLAGVAHELNNPLAILIAQATLLKERAETDDVRRRAERIHAAADRSGRIIKSFLAMARQKPPSRERVNLNGLIVETLEMLGYGLRSFGIEVVRDLDPALPEISVDTDMIRQVIANLILNAQQALSAADPPRRLTIRTRGGGDAVGFEIDDNGPGVPADIASRIFDPFFTTKPAGVGTGIGLAICRGIVLAHEGRLELVSRDKPGAMFRLTLPLGWSEASGLQVDGPAVPAGRILIVDDERDVGESLGEILEALGQQALVLTSAKEGLERAKREHFDRVFVDLRMPEMGGDTFIKQLAETVPRLAARTVLMTGDTVRGPGTLLGAGWTIPILEKPFSLADVRAMLAAPPAGGAADGG